ncbi:MAG: 50S ribosomal protein L25 [Bacteroidetes bacterium]|nr:50S ribosomal protein L25 [Bacteroidota bacterium]
MSEIKLEAKIANKADKSVKSIRDSGLIPGIFYSHGEENIRFSATILDLRPIVFTSDTHIINLNFDNGISKKCILKDIQFDPVTDLLIHVDLQGIKEKEKLNINIPVILKGSAQGVKDGGVLQFNMHTLHISCLPKYIPEHIKLDITNLKINDSIHVRDLVLENITILDNLKNNIVGVVPPTVIKEETPADVALVPTEPELITRAKKDDEEAVIEEQKK